MAKHLFALIGSCALAACGPTGAHATNDAGDANASPLDAAAPDVFGPAFGDATTADGSDGCPDSAKLVYVTGIGGQLWSFYPPTLQFKLIGTLSCLPDLPDHMTVDRHGVAWIDCGGTLYTASTTDASCQLASTWQPNVTFGGFALSFAGKTAIDNTLYLLSGNLLGRFDVPTGIVTTVGTIAIPDVPGDMTATGDGSLYYLWDNQSPTLYRISPAQGQVLSQETIAAPGGGSQGLAFWGGSFWVFENSEIYAYDPATKKTAAHGKAPLDVTGAGQSTCVPATPN